MLYEHALKEHHRLEQEIKSIRRQISYLPDGNLYFVHDKQRIKWFYYDGQEHYIPKKDRTFAEQLALKKFLSHQLQNYLHEKSAIEFYLRHHDFHAEDSLQNLITTPEMQELLSISYKPLSQELVQWQNVPYHKNPNHPEQLIHQTLSGNLVRSKSEVLIDTHLFLNKIPFHYEETLVLGDITLYPDFKTRHPITGNVIFWEHFGLMDNPTYSKNAFHKLQIYISHKIIPGVQLITTYETREQPLTIGTVKNIINQYYF